VAPAPTNAEAFAAAKAMPLDELYQRALGEGGSFVFYATLSQSTGEKVFGAFEQRFPGIKVEQYDASGDKLVARVVTEARGGRTLADAFHSSVNYIQHAQQQALLLQDIPAEALAIPEQFRGQYWVATTQQFIVVAYNTDRVRPDEVPRQYEDLADPRWKDRLMLDPSDVELYMGLWYRSGSQEQGEALLRRIGANNPAFHRGHSELAELLAAGQGDVCITCYADHILARKKRGAPVDYMRTEGINPLSASAVMKDAPHPYTAMLWQRWVSTEEGQQSYADGGRAPPHPNVILREPLSPDTVYSLGPDDLTAAKRHEGTWKAIFNLR
jgi:iron(III) transport system substrate-binding protein